MEIIRNEELHQMINMIQKSKWLWICKHNVYRKPTEWNGKPFNIFERKTAWSTKKSGTLLRDNIYFCNRSRHWRHMFVTYRNKSNMDLKYTACNSMCDDD